MLLGCVRVWFWSDDPDESVRIDMFIQKPNALNVFVGDTLVAMGTSMPQLNSSAVRSRLCS